MGAWKFRLRFRMPETSGFSVEESKLVVDVNPWIGPLVLEVWPRGNGPISQAEWLVLTGTAPSEEDAWERGAALARSAQRAFARLRIAADFGDRAAKGGLGVDGKHLIKGATGRPALDDVHGLMVFPEDPKPWLLSVGSITAKMSAQEDRLRVALEAALEEHEVLGEDERIAYDLYAASFFDSSADSRLITLVTAVETMVTPIARTAKATEHVEGLIVATRESRALAEDDRASLISGLRELRNKSITASGVDFLNARLGERKYGDESPGQLWKTAYRLRSKLVHGSVPRPTRDEVGRCAARLEVMVSNLLAGSLIDLAV